MYELITSSLFQKKSCQLPGIGSLSLVTHPAVADFVNTQIKAPVQKIVFVAGVPREKRFNEFSVISDMIQRRLEEGEKVEIPGAGLFFKNSNGAVDFEALIPDPALMPPVHAERIVRQHAQHSILVGDRETTNIAITESRAEAVEMETASAKGRWWVWAAASGLAALLLFVYYFSMKGFNSLGSLAQP